MLHILRGGISFIDNHQTLFGINFSATHGGPFHACVFYEPSGCQFHALALIHRISHNIRRQRLNDLAEVISVHNGVAEETACASNLFRVREFGFADSADFIAHLGYCGHMTKTFAEALQGTVIKIFGRM